MASQEAGKIPGRPSGRTTGEDWGDLSPTSCQDQFSILSKFDAKMVVLGWVAFSRISKWIWRSNRFVVLGHGTQNLLQSGWLLPPMGPVAAHRTANDSPITANGHLLNSLTEFQELMGPQNNDIFLVLFLKSQRPCI